MVAELISSVSSIMLVSYDGNTRIKTTPNAIFAPQIPNVLALDCITNA